MADKYSYLSTTPPAAVSRCLDHTLSCTMTYPLIKEASSRLEDVCEITPVLTSRFLDKLSGRHLVFKMENFQKTGSCSSRGAHNAVKALIENNEFYPKGVVTCSGGNHGIGLAWAARLQDLPCVVVMPKKSEFFKRQAVVGHGAEVVFSESSRNENIALCDSIAQQRDYVVVQPDNIDVIAGLGTAGVEMVTQAPYLDALLVPAGNGNLIAGIAVAVKKMNPAIKVYAVDSEDGILQDSMLKGKPLWRNSKTPDTRKVDDRTQPGEIAFPIMLDFVEKHVLVVSDRDMTIAMRYMYERLKVVVTRKAASGLAAALSAHVQAFPPEIHNIGVVITDGNVNLHALDFLTAESSKSC